MRDACALAARIEPATQMREASGVIRDDELRRGRVGIRELAIENARRDLGVIERERPSEAATHARFGHLGDLETGDLAQQTPRLVVEAQDVRGLAGIVVRHP